MTRFTQSELLRLLPLWSKLGTVEGVGLGGVDMWCNKLGFSLSGTLHHGHPDSETLLPGIVGI